MFLLLQFISIVIGEIDAFSIFVSALSNLQPAELRTALQQQTFQSLVESFVVHSYDNDQREVNFLKTMDLYRSIDFKLPYSAAQVGTLELLAKNVLVDPIVTDELGTCQPVSLINSSCYCSAFHLNRNALYWTTDALKSRIDSIGSFSTFARHVCFDDSKSFAWFMKLLCSVAYTECPLNSKIGTKLFYNETVRVCKNDCELAGKTHSDSLANSQVGLTAPSQDATLLKIVPFVATLCRAATFYVNCSTSVFDNSAQCARKILSAKQSNVSVVAGVANCLVSATKPICDWSHEINNSSSKCSNINNVPLVLRAFNMNVKFLDGEELKRRKLAPTAFVEYTRADTGETVVVVLDIGRVSEALYIDGKAIDTVSPSGYNKSHTISYFLNSLSWSVQCLQPIDGLPTSINYAALFKGATLTISFALSTGAQTTNIAGTNYTVASGALKLSMSIDNGEFQWSNDAVNRLVFTVGARFPPFAGYAINFFYDDPKSTDQIFATKLAFDLSDVSVLVSMPSLHKIDDEFHRTNLVFPVLGNATEFFNRRSCPNGDFELGFQRFVRSFSYDPDFQFILSPIALGSDVEPYSSSTEIDKSTSSSIGIIAAITTSVIVVPVAVIASVLYFCRKKALSSHRVAAE